MQLPQKVKLKPEQIAMLSTLQNEQIGIQQFVQSVTAQGQQRSAELAAKLKKAWSDIAKDHGLNLDHVAYDFDGEYAVPKMVRMS